jgi:lysophospholipase L1-like esterase
VVPEGSQKTLVSRLESGCKQTIITYGTSLTKVAAWTDQLATILEQNYPGQVTFINSAQGGSNSDWGSRSFDEKVIQNKPDTVFIEFAFKDAVARCKTSVEHARQNLPGMIDHLLQARPNCEIILMVMNPPVGQTAEQRPNLAAYNQMYREVAKTRELQRIDHYPAWEELLNEDLGASSNTCQTRFIPYARGRSA